MALATVAGFALAVSMSGGAQAQDTLKVGLLATFEGPFTVLGEDSKRGAELALAEHNGMAGGKKIEWVIGSSDASPDSAIRAIRKLVEQDGVQIVVGPLSGDEGLAVKDYAKTQPNVTFVNGTSAAQDTTLRDPAQTSFRFHRRRAMDGQRRHLALKKGLKVATVAETIHPTRRCSASWRSSGLAGCRVEILVPIGNDSLGDRRHSGGCRRGLSLGGADGVNFLKQHQDAGGTAPLIGGSITADQTVLSSQGKQKDAVLGMPSGGPVADAWDNDAWKKFVADYKKMFPDGFPSPSLFAHGYYVNTTAVLLALDKVNGDISDNGAKLRETLASLEFDTPTGPVKLDANRNAIANIFVTEVAQGDDGNLYNKVVEVKEAVNQTLGQAPDEFLKLGVVGRDNPACP
jgi:branched-chain amino acid transport system substrate-binding protein